jgi:hypothetical protein
VGAALGVGERHGEPNSIHRILLVLAKGGLACSG